MSNKKSKIGREPDSTGKRSYTQRARAARRDEVHRRITLATVYLHGTVGPARTTVSDIAKRAGVRRATVYNHFATDLELIDACSSHWFGENPPPDQAAWREIADPHRRAETAIGAMYTYYESGRHMLENVLRDTPQVPALEQIIRQKWWPMLDGIAEILADGWGHDEVENRATETGERTDPKAWPISRSSNLNLRASIKVALDFFTWHTLAESGLKNDEAAKLAVSWVEAGRELGR